MLAHISRINPVPRFQGTEKKEPLRYVYHVTTEGAWKEMQKAGTMNPYTVFWEWISGIFTVDLPNFVNQWHKTPIPGKPGKPHFNFLSRLVDYVGLKAQHRKDNMALLQIELTPDDPVEVRDNILLFQKDDCRSFERSLRPLNPERLPEDPDKLPEYILKKPIPTSRIKHITTFAPLADGQELAKIPESAQLAHIFNPNRITDSHTRQVLGFPEIPDTTA